MCRRARDFPPIITIICTSLGSLKWTLLFSLIRGAFIIIIHNPCCTRIIIIMCSKTQMLNHQVDLHFISTLRPFLHSSWVSLGNHLPRIYIMAAFWDITWDWGNPSKFFSPEDMFSLCCLAVFSFKFQELEFYWEYIWILSVTISSRTTGLESIDS